MLKKIICFCLTTFFCILSLSACQKSDLDIGSTYSSTDTKSSTLSDKMLSSANETGTTNETQTSSLEESKNNNSSKTNYNSTNNSSINNSTIKNSNIKYELCDLDCYHQVYTKLYVICFKVKKDGNYIRPSGFANVVYLDIAGNEIFSGDIQFVDDSDIFFYDESTSLSFITFKENQFKSVPNRAKITVKCDDYTFESKSLKMEESNSEKTQSSPTLSNISIPNLPLIINQYSNYSTMKINEIITSYNYSKVTFNISGEVLKKGSYTQLKCYLYDEEGYVMEEYGYCGDIPVGSKFKTNVIFYNLENDKEYRLEIVDE